MTTALLTQAVFTEIIRAVENVQEFPGPMPEELWDVLSDAYQNGNRALIEESYRMAVRHAKRDALENLGFVRNDEGKWFAPGADD